MEVATILEPLSAPLDFFAAIFPRDDVDELDEYELSEPESLESDEPDADELDRLRRFSVEVLRAGEDCRRKARK